MTQVLALYNIIIMFDIDIKHSGQTKHIKDILIQFITLVKIFFKTNNV